MIFLIYFINQGTNENKFQINITWSTLKNSNILIPKVDKNI